MGFRAQERPAQLNADHGGAWPLPAATVAVLDGGHGRLGSVLDGALRAAVGCVPGLVSSTLLPLLVESVMPGRPLFRRRGRTAPLPRRSAH
ncbi:hypothetical protein ABZ079_34800 [Streptomyces sp. NPDC006314]|uniref:hypothetical protein n=1 Tax=Streptomyces sp. NPDC006314 TaxID=3154475 RepID=UPI0033BC75DF